MLDPSASGSGGVDPRSSLTLEFDAHGADLARMCSVDLENQAKVLPLPLPLPLAPAPPLPPTRSMCRALLPLCCSLPGETAPLRCWVLRCVLQVVLHTLKKQQQGAMVDRQRELRESQAKLVRPCTRTLMGLPLRVCCVCCV